MSVRAGVWVACVRAGGVGECTRRVRCCVVCGVNSIVCVRACGCVGRVCVCVRARVRACVCVCVVNESAPAGVC